MKHYIDSAFKRLEVSEIQTQSDAALELCMMLEVWMWPDRVETFHRDILSAEALSSRLNEEEISEFVVALAKKVSDENLAIDARLALITALGKTEHPAALISIVEFLNIKNRDLDDAHLCGTLAAIKIYNIKQADFNQVETALQKFNTKAVLEQIVETGSADASAAAARILTTISKSGFREL